MGNVWHWPDFVNRLEVPIIKPFSLSTDRVTYVSAGTVEAEVNLHPVSLTSGCVLYTEQGTVIILITKSDNLEAVSCSVTENPLGDMHPHHRVFAADKALRTRQEHWFFLLENVATVTTPHVLAPLQQAMLADLFSNGRPLERPTNPTRQQCLYNDFIALVAEHALEQRSVGYYADRLHLSTSRLMSLVKQYSGRTVMQWINLRTVQQAKEMLRYSDKPVSEVAEAVGMDDANYFSRFFRHEVGMNPTQWRRKGVFGISQSGM